MRRKEKNKLMMLSIVLLLMASSLLVVSIWSMERYNKLIEENVKLISEMKSELGSNYIQMYKGDVLTINFPKTGGYVVLKAIDSENPGYFRVLVQG